MMLLKTLLLAESWPQKHIWEVPNVIDIVDQECGRSNRLATVIGKLIAAFVTGMQIVVFASSCCLVSCCIAGLVARFQILDSKFVANVSDI
jgi:hypothetical protein